MMFLSSLGYKKGIDLPTTVSLLQEDNNAGGVLESFTSSAGRKTAHYPPLQPVRCAVETRLQPEYHDVETKLSLGRPWSYLDPLKIFDKL